MWEPESAQRSTNHAHRKASVWILVDRPTGRNRRGARWRGGRGRWDSFALSQHDLPGEFALVCLGSFVIALKSRIFGKWPCTSR